MCELCLGPAHAEEFIHCDLGASDWPTALRAVPDKHFLAWETQGRLLPSGGEGHQLRATDLLQIDPLDSALPHCFLSPTAFP